MKASVPYQAELEQNFRAAYLISQFIQETISEEDEEELDRWMQQSELNMQIFEDLTDESMVRDFLTWYAERDTGKNNSFLNDLRCVSVVLYFLIVLGSNFSGGRLI